MDQIAKKNLSFKRSSFLCFIIGAIICLGPFISLFYSLFPNKILIGGFSIGKIVNSLFCLPMIIFLPLSPQTFNNRSNLFVPKLFFAYWIAVTAFYSILTTATLAFCFKIIFLLLIFLNVRMLSYHNHIDQKRFLGIGKLVLAATIVSQLYIYYKGGADPAMLDSRIAIAGTTFQTSRWGAFLVSILPVFFLKKHLQTQDFFYLFLLVVSSIITFRRSAFLAILSVIIIYILMNSNLKIKKTLKRMLIFTILILCAFYIIIHTPFIEGVLLKFNDLNLNTGGTASGRSIFWRITLSHLNDMDTLSFLIGDGLGALQKEMITYYGLGIGAHNDWLDILISFGLIGFVLFAWVVIKMCMISLSLYQRKSRFFFSSFAAIILFFVMSITTGGTLEPTFACLFGILGFCAGKELQLPSE